MRKEDKTVSKQLDSATALPAIGAALSRSHKYNRKHVVQRYQNAQLRLQQNRHKNNLQEKPRDVKLLEYFMAGDILALRIYNALAEGQ